MKKKLILAMAILSMVLSVGIILYPIISTVYNDAHQSEISIQHQEAIDQAPDAMIAQMKDAAIAYNKLLHPISQEDYTSEMLENSAEHYKEQLDLVGDGIMGYVDIPKIKVHLPIYHGTADTTLEIGVGHLLGSSLPVGGSGTHAVLTAHSGMASNVMFSDLPQLEEGDVFYLKVLNETLAYQVDQIRTVLPYETELLKIQPEQDLVTLVTCTPFGVNTHRLLVRGTRIPYVEETATEMLSTAADEEKAVVSNWEQEYVKGIVYGILLVLLILIICWGIHQWRKHHEKA